MKLGFFSRRQARTPFIQLNSRECQACWKCQAVCPNNVIGKVDLPWHRHARIVNGDNCVGCLECVGACETHALSEVDREKKPSVSGRKKHPAASLLINLGLLLAAAIMAFSGLLIQINYHMGNHGGIDTNNRALGIDYFGWAGIHKAAILTVSVLMVYHIVRHWKWYATIVRKGLVAKNKQTIILTMLFVVVAVTGYVPWAIDLAGGPSATRRGFVEIHDKLALTLLVLLVLHIAKRLKWYTGQLRHYGRRRPVAP